MRNDLEALALDEMRHLRGALAESIEDLDLALVGRFPADMADEHVLLQYRVFRELNAHGIWPKVLLVTMGAAMMMNEAGMVDRVNKLTKTKED